MTTPSAHHLKVHQDPNFGYDPWLNPLTDPVNVDAEHRRLLATGKLYHGQDTIGGDIGLLYPGLDVYFSYVDNLRGWLELVARFPHANQNLGLPWGYTSASNMQALINAAGGRQFIKESAHYGFGMHICGPNTCGYPQATWTQWADKGPNGENLDQVVGSLMPAPGPLLVSITVTPPGNRALFADVQPGGLTFADFAPWYDHTAIRNPIPPADPHHYGWFDTTKRIMAGGASELSTVLEYDKLRATQTKTKHPNRPRLAVLRSRCQVLGMRVAAIEKASHVKGLYHRGWRRDQLLARAKGQRLV